MNELQLIFDYGELQRHADLGSGETDAGSVTHGFAHGRDQVLNGLVENFGGGQRPRLVAQDCFTGLPDLEFHGRSLIDYSMIGGGGDVCAARYKGEEE